MLCADSGQFTGLTLSCYKYVPLNVQVYPISQPVRASDLKLTRLAVNCINALVILSLQFSILFLQIKKAICPLFINLMFL